MTGTRDSFRVERSRGTRVSDTPTMTFVLQALTAASDYVRYLMGFDTCESRLTLERRGDRVFLRRNRGQEVYSVELAEGTTSDKNVVSHDMQRYSVIYMDLPKTEPISDWAIVFGAYATSGDSLYSEHRARDNVIIVSSRLVGRGRRP